MPFALAKDRIRSAVDLQTGAHMVINSGPQIEFRKVEFTSPTLTLSIDLSIGPKFQNQPIAKNDPENPCIMFPAGRLNTTFEKKNMRDFQSNTRDAEYVVRLIAFINRHYPLATSPFLWSDYETAAKKQTFLYRMPSDEELLKISLQPE